MKLNQNKFLFGYFGATVIAIIAMYLTFQYSSNDLAGKACLQIAAKLQEDYKAKNGTFAASITDLNTVDPKPNDPKLPPPKASGIDARCLDYFALKVESGSTDGYAMTVKTKKTIYKINERQDITDAPNTQTSPN